eukprot:2691869-Prymnesium_polylepis.1
MSSGLFFDAPSGMNGMSPRRKPMAFEHRRGSALALSRHRTQLGLPALAASIRGVTPHCRSAVSTCALNSSSSLTHASDAQSRPRTREAAACIHGGAPSTRAVCKLAGGPRRILPPQSAETCSPQIAANSADCSMCSSNSAELLVSNLVAICSVVATRLTTAQRARSSSTHAVWAGVQPRAASTSSVVLTLLLSTITLARGSSSSSVRSRSERSRPHCTFVLTSKRDAARCHSSSVRSPESTASNSRATSSWYVVRSNGRNSDSSSSSHHSTHRSASSLTMLNAVMPSTMRGSEALESAGFARPPAGEALRNRGVRHERPPLATCTPNSLRQLRSPGYRGCQERAQRHIVSSAGRTAKELSPARAAGLMALRDSRQEGFHLLHSVQP